MENSGNNNRGMFYAVMGVATLVITIIGATFAYLTATTNSAVNAVTATGAEISLAYTDVSTGLKTDLIPIDESLGQFAKGTFTNSDNVTYSFVGIDAIDCKDVNGNNICSVYQFTVTNNTSVDVSQRVYVRMTPKTNTFENLHYAIFKGTATQVEATTAGYDVDGTVVTATSTDYDSFTIDAADASRKNKIANAGNLVVSDTALTKGNTTQTTWDPLEQILDKGESMTYTIVLWVHETGSEQDDQGGQFAAQIFIDTGSGEGVTGELTVG